MRKDLVGGGSMPSPFWVRLRLPARQLWRPLEPTFASAGEAGPYGRGLRRWGSHIHGRVPTIWQGGHIDRGGGENTLWEHTIAGIRQLCSSRIPGIMSSHNSILPPPRSVLPRSRVSRPWIAHTRQGAHYRTPDSVLPGFEARRPQDLPWPMIRVRRRPAGGTGGCTQGHIGSNMGQIELQEAIFDPKRPYLTLFLSVWPALDCLCEGSGTLPRRQTLTDSRAVLVLSCGLTMCRGLSSIKVARTGQNVPVLTPFWRRFTAGMRS